MTELSCGYGDDRDEALVAFLYDDADGSPVERAAFETHMRTCERCRADVEALRAVRAQLTRWAPPEPSFAVVSRQSSVVSRQSSVGSRQSSVGSRQSSVGSQQSSVDNPQSPLRTPHSALLNPQSAIRNPQWWNAVPAWAQVAAALLFLGVSAGVANLDVRYDQSGLSVKTGWSGRASAVAGSGRSGASSGPGRSGESGGLGFTPADPAAPWRADLAALERQLKTELRATPASAPPQTGRAASATDADVIRRVRALVDESEKRQQRELALRLAGLLRDVNVQRQADLVKIDRTLGVVQNNVGIEVMKNRQQLNQMDLLYRASQKQ